ncbi:Chaperone protein ClpB [bioreactor metagenome]|uniref:Chaperone protein ClpB n=1 Tax=bioreactor metagenome TaxID=1076179 RepID=A0A645JKK1_9ZZZZ
MFYKPLNKEAITTIVDLLMKELNSRLKENKLKCTLTPRAKAFIAEEGFDPVYGARPLKRYLQKTVETLIAKIIIKDDPKPDTEFIVDEKNGELFVKGH